MSKLFKDGVARNRVTSVKFSNEEHTVLSAITAEKVIRTNNPSWNVGKVIRESVVLDPDFFDYCFNWHKKTKEDLEAFMHDQESLSYRELLSTRDQKWLNYFYESTGCGFCLDSLAFDILGIEKEELQQLSIVNNGDILKTIAHLDSPLVSSYVKNAIYQKLYDQFMEASNRLHLAFYSVKNQMERISCNYSKVAKMYKETEDTFEVFFGILEQEAEKIAYEDEQDMEIDIEDHPIF